jgi:4-hydroxyphenylpyruvate dioxygenase-like putative hemolysin
MIPHIDPEDRELLALPAVSQIGVVVKEMHPAIDFYSEVWNVGPFKIFEPEYTDQTYRGKPGNFKMRIALASLDPVQFELIEPLEGDTIYDEFLEKKGEGLHHLGFDVDRIEDRITAMQKMGIEVLQSGKRPGVAFAYMDTEPLAGIIMEFIER